MASERILIVEDETIISQELATSLSEMGFDVVGSAVTGNEAIDLARDLSPDLILMDIMLRGKMDGIDAARAIQQSQDIPVIYLTAYADESIMERAKLTSPYGYVIKPYDARELRISIEVACIKHQLERRVRDAMKRYQGLLEASGAIPWEMDAADKRFTYLGPQLRRVLGYAPTGWDRLDSMLMMVRPEMQDVVRTVFDEASSGEGKTVSLEFAIRALGGREVWLRDTISSSRDEDGTLRLRGYMIDITKRRQAELDREKYITELKGALDRIKTLHGLLPICAWCKRIRDDKGYWKQLEVYIEEHSEAEFTHSMCPECRKKMEEGIQS